MKAIQVASFKAPGASALLIEPCACNLKLLGGRSKLRFLRKESAGEIPRSNDEMDSVINLSQH
jgi:hypothetical protein